MEKVIIWHNPCCRKSREGLQYLQEKGVKPEIIDYLKNAFLTRRITKNYGIVRTTGR